MPNTRHPGRRLTLVAAAILLTLAAAATVVLAASNAQDRNAQPGVSLEPAHARIGDSVTVSVRNIDGATDGYQVYLIPEAAIETDEDRTQGCVTHQVGDILPLHLGTTQRYQTEVHTEHRATGYLPGRPAGLPEGRYRPCITWMKDNQLHHWAASAVLRIIGRIDFSTSERSTVIARITGGSPNTKFALYRYARNVDGDTCSGGIVLGRGLTDVNGAGSINIMPLDYRLDIGEQICATSEDRHLMAYGELNTLPSGNIRHINPTRGPRGTPIRITARESWPPMASTAVAYVETRPPPAEGACYGPPPNDADDRYLRHAPIDSSGALSLEFSADNGLTPGNNTICIRWADHNGVTGDTDLMPPIMVKFFLTMETTANSADTPAAPGAPINITNTDLRNGSRLLRMQWQGKTYPVDTFSNPNAGNMIVPLQMHVTPPEAVPATDGNFIVRKAKLHWETPDSSTTTTDVTLYLIPVQITVDGNNNSIEPFSVTMQGVDGERPMAVNYCQHYGSQMPRRVMGTGTATEVEVNPADLEDASRLRRGINILCVELLDWHDYGYDQHYRDGVHPAVATLEYDVRATLAMPESALIGTAVDATATDLPPGVTLERFTIDGVVMTPGSAYAATAANRFGNATIRFIVPANMGNRSAVNRTVTVKAVYTDGSEVITPSGRLLILPATPSALGSLQPPGDLAGVPYLTFRPRSAVINQPLTVRTRNLAPPDATLKAVKLNGHLVYGQEGDQVAQPGNPEYLEVQSAHTLGQNKVTFTVPAKIGDEKTEYQIKVELHWDPGKDTTDPYGNQLIVVSHTIPLFTGEAYIKPEECNAMVRLDADDLRAGANLNPITIRVATGSFGQPMNCPKSGTQAGASTIPEGDITIRLQGDFQLGAPGQQNPSQANLRADVAIVVLDAQTQEAGHDANTHTHGRPEPQIQPDDLVSISSIGPTSIILNPGPLIRGPWSYRQQAENARTPCLEVPEGGRAERIGNLTHGTRYIIQIFNRPGCVQSANAGTVTFTTASGTDVYGVEPNQETLRVLRRGDALTLTIPGCTEWTNGPNGARSATDICHSIRPRFIDFRIMIPGLRMPAQATRNPDERVAFTIEWEHQGLAAQRDIYAYTTADLRNETSPEEPSQFRPPLVALANQGLAFLTYGEHLSVAAYGHVQYTNVDFYTFHDGGASDQNQIGDAADATESSAAALTSCADALSTGISIPAARSFATLRNAAATIDTANGNHSRVGLYHLCARGGGGIITADHRNENGRPAYRARFVVGMNAEPTGQDHRPNAGELISIRIHGYEAVSNNQPGYTEEPLVIDEITVGGRRLIGPIAGRPADWKHWRQDNQILEIRLPPDVQGNVNIQLWATSPKNSIDRTCTADVPHRNEDLAAIYRTACYQSITLEIQPPKLEILDQAAVGLTINEEFSVRVSGLPGNQVCHAAIGSLPVTLLDEIGDATNCVDLSPHGQDSHFRLAMRIPNDGPQTQLVRFYVLNAGASGSAGAEGGETALTVITDLNAQSSTGVTLRPPTVQLLNPGTARRLDKLTLRGEQFPRERGAKYPIDIVVGDCAVRCKQRRAHSVPLWEFDHILRRQPRPPGQEIPISVKLADVPITVEGIAKSPEVAMEISPNGGAAEATVTVHAQGLKAHRGGYSVHIRQPDGRGPPIIFRDPPQSDGRGEFTSTGVIPWWEHDGGTAEYATVFQLYDGQQNQVDDAEFTFLYRNREAPATPRPTPPATAAPSLETTRATPRPARHGATATPPPTAVQIPTATPSLILSTATPPPPPTATPPPAQPIRSLAELIEEREPSPTPTPEATATPIPLVHIGQLTTPKEPTDTDNNNPWTYIIGGALLLLLAAAIGIALLIWKRPPRATVTAMGRVSDDAAPPEAPTIITGRGYLDDEPRQPSPNRADTPPQ